MENRLGTLVSHIDLEALPAGQLSRLRVQIVEDGRGYPVTVPMIVAKGRKAGPRLGLTAAIHGNELNGIPVIHRLTQNLDLTRLSGTLIAALCLNVPGFERNQRRFIDNIDLNTRMPGDASGNVSNLYAARLVERILPNFDHLIDLHTASNGRINSLYARVDTSDERSSKMARLLKPQIIVHKPAADKTWRGEASERGVPSVTLEIGNPQRFQLEHVRNSVSGIRNIMADLKMIAKRPPREGRDPIFCESSFWMYTDRGGLLTVHPELRARVRQGETVATLTNIYGDKIAEYQSPEDAVVIGKSVNPVGYSGARIVHLGKEITRS